MLDDLTSTSKATGITINLIIIRRSPGIPFFKC